MRDRLVPAGDRPAAGLLFVSASAVSHRIRSLERELEVPLSVRKPSALELTEDGERLFAEIDPLIRRIDAVTRGFSPSPADSRCVYIGAAVLRERDVRAATARVHAGSPQHRPERRNERRSGYYFVCKQEDEEREDVRALREWMLQTFVGLA